MASRRSINKDDNFYRRVIHKSLTRFLDDLDTSSIIDLFLEREFVPYAQVRDLQALRLPSEKVKAILDKVASRGRKGYREFKKFLIESQQEHLAEFLDDKEAELEKEIRMAEKEQGQMIPARTLPTGRHRKPDDKELLSMAEHIGFNWEMLGPFLGVPTPTVDQINMDNSTTHMKIYRLLYVWRSMNGSDATIENLLSKMREAPQSVNISWEAVEGTVRHYDELESNRVGQTGNAQQKKTFADQLLYQRGPLHPPNSTIDNVGSSLQQLNLGLLKIRAEDPRGINNATNEIPQLQSYDPSFAAKQGGLGNTRRQGEDYSNENIPDVSRSSFQNRPDGRPQDAATVGTQSQSKEENPIKEESKVTDVDTVTKSGDGNYVGEGRKKVQGSKEDQVRKEGQGNVDETDAARNRSIEREFNQSLPLPTYVLRTVSSSGVTKLGVANTQPEASKVSVTPETGINVSEEPRRPEKNLIRKFDGIINELETMKTDIQNKDNSVPLKGPHSSNDVVPRKAPDPSGMSDPANQQADDAVDGTKEARDKELRKFFESEEDMKGRLKVLPQDIVNHLLCSCGNEPAHKGGFGDIFVSKDKVPGVDMRLVLKRVHCVGETTEQKMRSLTSEKLCARTKHFAIVPLLGIQEDIINRTFYFLSPYMENGNLNQIIEEDNTRANPVLDACHRLRIMFQIASAIDVLHTGVPGIRGVIIHSDIKSLNIVLDQNLNARIIDFGLAREMREGCDQTKTTAIQYYATPGYGTETNQQKIARHADYRYFGVVMRELLTGKKPIEDGASQNLKELSVMKIFGRLMTMWLGKKKLTIELIKLSENCINDKEMTSQKPVEKLKDFLKETNTNRWNFGEDKNSQSKTCEMCLEYKAVDKKVLSHKSCERNMNVCVVCMQNSYCNPIRCHSCDETITPTIGHGWAALLIAGNEKIDSVAKSFTADVEAVHKVITSKCPLVMGVRDDYVQTVCPKKPGKPENMKAKLEKSVTELKKLSGVDTLLLYYSGHFKPEKGGFELSFCGTEKKDEFEYISVEDLESIIASVLQKSADPKEPFTKRVIVFLDCCSTPAVSTRTNIKEHPSEETDCSNTDVPAASGDANLQNKGPPCLSLDKNIRIVQINACRQNQKAIQEPNGSIFRKFLIQGLTGKALGEPCIICRPDKCQYSIQGDFVTVANLNAYITDHYPQSENLEPVMYVYNASKLDAYIGYVINYKADLAFTYKFKEEKVASGTIQQRMFSKLPELQVLLFDEYVGKMGLDKTIDKEPKLSTTDLNGILCVTIEKGPKSQQRDRLDNIDRIMTAWNAKRELVVSLRTLQEILSGMVGIFLDERQTVQPIIDLLQKNENVQKKEEDHVTTFTVKIGKEFDELVQTVMIIAPKELSIESLNDHLDDLNQAFKNRLEEKEKVEEIHIIFPCSVTQGERIHRRDFMCYNLKWKNG